MNRFIALHIDSFSVVLDEFTVGGYDQTFADSGDVSYSLAGNAVIDGPAYEQKLVWTITALITREQWDILQLVFKRCERKRRQPPTNFAITLDDTVSPVLEDGSRTRAIVPGHASTPVSGGAVSYPARFAVRMFQPKAIEQGGLKPFQVSFVLKELDKVSP